MGLYPIAQTTPTPLPTNAITSLLPLRHSQNESLLCVTNDARFVVGQSLTNRSLSSRCRRRRRTRHSQRGHNWIQARGPFACG